MEIDKFPSPLVIGSWAGADAETRQWLHENTDAITDADGTVWHVRTQKLEIPDADEPHRGVWQISVFIKTELVGSELVQCGLLNAEKDSRLLEFLGDERIPVHVRPRVFTAKTLELAKTQYTETLLRLREDFRATSFSQIKHDLIARWLEDRMRFGMKVAADETR